jgi:AAA domain
MGERLSFKRLVLTGPGRNYEVRFHDGVNLITGPIWTGKSSVLRLIDYACGASRAPSYPELAKCSDLYVECVAGGETLTVRRSLRSATARAMLYEGPIDHVFDHALQGVEISARYVRDAASVSSELMQRLGLGSIDVKAAPTQEASELTAFSIRDLLLIAFIDQDRMGSSQGFFEGHPFKKIKWRAAFEIAHYLFDQAAAKLANALKDAEAEEARIRQYLAHAQSFLDQFNIPRTEDLEKQVVECEIEEKELAERIRLLRKNAELNLGGNLELVKQRGALDDQRSSISARIGELRRSLAQLGRLRVQYGRERAQLEFLKESESLVGDLPVVRCPACLQSVDPKHHHSSCYLCNRPLPSKGGEVSADARLRSIRRRILDLEGYLGDVEGTVTNLEAERKDVSSKVSEIDQALRRLRESSVLPDTRPLAEASEALAMVEQRGRKAREYLELRRKARGEGSNLLAVAERVGRLRSDVQAAAEGRKSPAELISELSELFVSTLKAIRFPEMRDSRIDAESYHPVVRNQSYRQLSSKGAIALAMVSWHLAVLRYALGQRSRFPKVLMLDSPLSHVGHDASDAEFKDQQIVDAFYQMLLGLHHKHGPEFQLIIVDNRPPASADEMIAVEFTGDATRGRFGLIDDEHPPVSQAPPKAR